MHPCLHSCSPFNGVANTEEYSQHQGWYVEHSKKVSGTFSIVVGQLAEINAQIQRQL